MRIGKFILLFLTLNIDMNVVAQQCEIYGILSPYHPCFPILDSLDRTKYFDRCIKVNPDRSLAEFYMFLNYSRGCYRRSDEKFELVFNGCNGYLIKSTRDGYGSYIALTEIKTIVNLVDKLNKTFAFDSVLLIRDTSAFNSSSSGGGNLKINMKFVNGEIIERDLNFGDINSYCVFLPALFNYFTDIFRLSFKPLDSSSARILLNGYNSQIALNFLYRYELGLPRLMPQGINLEEYIIPMRNNGKIGKTLNCL